MELRYRRRSSVRTGIDRDVSIWLHEGTWHVISERGAIRTEECWSSEKSALFAAERACDGRWPFYVSAHCTDRTTIDALRDHVHRVHKWMLWPERSWESMVMNHADSHERRSDLAHEHGHLPGVAW
jgi:hypothetical protein